MRLKINSCCIAITYRVEVNRCTKDYRHAGDEYVRQVGYLIQNQAFGMLRA